MTDSSQWPGGYWLLVVVIAAIAFTFVAAAVFPNQPDPHKTITVTDKQTYGADQIIIFEGSNRYRAPGYLWDFVVVGEQYNITWSGPLDAFSLGGDGAWVMSISRVDE